MKSRRSDDTADGIGLRLRADLRLLHAAWQLVQPAPLFDHLDYVRLIGPKEDYLPRGRTVDVDMGMSIF